MIKNPRVSAATLVALGTLAVGANSASAASNRVAVKASFSGRAQITSQATTSFAGAGVASHMGRIVTAGHADITGFDSSCPGGVANVNTETLIAANGDKLTIASQDVACPTGPGQYHGTGQWTVTGGTGRFGSAAGRGTYDGSADFNATTFTITLTGTLVIGTDS